MIIVLIGSTWSRPSGNTDVRCNGGGILCGGWVDKCQSDQECKHGLKCKNSICTA